MTGPEYKQPNMVWTLNLAKRARPLPYTLSLAPSTNFLLLAITMMYIQISAKHHTSLISFSQHNYLAYTHHPLLSMYQTCTFSGTMCMRLKSWPHHTWEHLTERIQKAINPNIGFAFDCIKGNHLLDCWTWNLVYHTQITQVGTCIFDFQAPHNDITLWSLVCYYMGRWNSMKLKSPEPDPTVLCEGVRNCHSYSFRKAFLGPYMIQMP